jgi:hypothetical protein
MIINSESLVSFACFPGRTLTFVIKFHL